ncbi:leucine-rich repeat domain-containing protein [bacterium]|nr:leucine-rich repeat domain-containing protein [bacterium]
MKKPVFNLVWLFLIVYSLQVNGGKLGLLTYEIADRQVAITDCKTVAKGELVIPSKIEGLPVNSIGYAAFSDCTSLTSIIIPESVTSIGHHAFRRATV